MNGCNPRRLLGDTAAEARQKRALLDSFVHPGSGIASLSIALGHVATGLTRRITG
jgi:alkanesulfonate monooxygenase